MSFRILQVPTAEAWWGWQAALSQRERLTDVEALTIATKTVEALNDAGPVAGLVGMARAIETALAAKWGIGLEGGE